MPLPRHSSFGRAWSALICGLVVLQCGLGGAIAVAGNQPEASTVFDRPDAATIRSETHEILTDPRFAPHKSVMQWLLEKLSALPRFRIDAGSGWARLLVWVVMIWCILALLAIFAHIGWTLFILLRRKARDRGLREGKRLFQRAQPTSYDEIRERMRLLVDAGAFREAIGVMMIALVRWLDTADILRFHHSKTNGDYVREYPAARLSRASFRHFAMAFDETVYGGASCRREVYQRMHTMFKQVLDRVRQESQI